MFREEWKQKVFFTFLQLLAFSIPFPFIYSSICVILLLLSWLAAAKVRQSLSYLKERPPLWPWLGFFVLHALSYFYSYNKGQSLFDIERKLSFLVLPLVIGTHPGFTDLQVKRVLRAFAAGVTVCAVICLAQATAVWAVRHTTGQFFYHQLVTGFEANAVYFAWYSVMALSILLLVPWTLRRPVHRWLLGLVATVNFVFFLLLSARLLLVLFMLLMPVALAFRFRKRGKTWAPWLIVGVAATGLCVLLLVPNPIRNRFEEVLHNNSEEVWLPADREKQHFNNLTLRLFLWKMALENVQDHQLWWKGCGNGDVDTLQHLKINEYQHRLNPHDLPTDQPLWEYNLHNMYLQILMMLGIPGLLLFLLMIFSPFLYFRAMGDWQLWFVFHLVSCLFFIQESALQTQAGIIYYTFFSIICWQVVWKTRKSVNNTAETQQV